MENINNDNLKSNKVWVFLNYWYFKSAQLLVEYLFSQKNIGKISNRKINYSTYNPIFSLENGAIFLSAWYNFRHALELSMKSLFLTAQKKVPKWHNLDDLCKNMEIKLLNYSILSYSFDAWKWLIDKYYKNDKFAPYDNMNELYRYMFWKNGIQFQYKSIHNLSKKDLINFLRDIKTAKNLFFMMQSQYGFIRLWKKFNINLNNKYRKCTKTIVCKYKNWNYITKRKAWVFKSKMLDD